jgi:enamine deaminase RidA (YjgF/YER057c/UK114 family)
MSNVYDRLKELNLTLPEPPQKAGVYTQCVEFDGNLAYVSGCGPNLNGVEKFKGKLGELSLEEGQEAAKCCALNVLAILHRDLGDLNRIKKFVKSLTFVASTNDFYSQPKVANGASNLLVDVLGEERGRPARSAIGVNVLPGNIPVEIEYLIELNE